MRPHECNLGMLLGKFLIVLLPCMYHACLFGVNDWCPTFFSDRQQYTMVFIFKYCQKIPQQCKMKILTSSKEGSRMEGLLHTDLWKSETSREIMILVWFFDLSTAFRFQRPVWECSLHICSCHYIICLPFVAFDFAILKFFTFVVFLFISLKPNKVICKNHI